MVFNNAKEGEAKVNKGNKIVVVCPTGFASTGDPDLTDLTAEYVYL